MRLLYHRRNVNHNRATNYMEELIKCAIIKVDDAYTCVCGQNVTSRFKGRVGRVTVIASTEVPRKVANSIRKSTMASMKQHMRACLYSNPPSYRLISEERYNKETDIVRWFDTAVEIAVHNQQKRDELRGPSEHDKLIDELNPLRIICDEQRIEINELKKKLVML